MRVIKATSIYRCDICGAIQKGYPTYKNNERCCKPCLRMIKTTLKEVRI